MSLPEYSAGWQQAKAQLPKSALTMIFFIYLIMEEIIKIPEGYEAKIEGNKVVFIPKESEDERIRKDLINLIGWLKANPKLCSQYYNDRYDEMLAYLEKKKEQKSAEWSEKDERMLESVIDTIGDSILECDCDDTGTKARFALEEEQKWLKSLPERFNLQPKQEWNEGDDACYETIKGILEDNLTEEDKPEYILSWFKSHYLHYHWEPGKEQGWSKEDEEKIDDIIRIICTARECSQIANIGEKKGDNSDFYNKLVLFLKSLRPQPIGDID